MGQEYRTVVDKGSSYKRSSSLFGIEDDEPDAAELADLELERLVPTMRNPDRYKALADKAICRGADTQRWMKGTSKGAGHITPEGALDQYARKLCWTCPVREACFEYAVETLPWYGVWGGKPASDAWAAAEGKAERRTCMVCKARRLARFFPERETPLCEDCSLPDDGVLAEAYRNLPNEMVEQLFTLSRRRTWKIKKRLWDKGLLKPHRLPPSGNMGRPRKVPDDDTLVGLLSSGRSNTSIGDELGVHRATVAYHRRRLVGEGRVAS